MVRERSLKFHNSKRTADYPPIKPGAPCLTKRQRSEIRILSVGVLTFEKRSYDSSPGLGGLQTSPMITWEKKKESEGMKRKPTMKEGTKESLSWERMVEKWRE